MRIAGLAALVAALTVTAVAQAQEAVATPTPIPGKVLATFAGESITEAQAEDVLGPQLVRARQEEYQVLSEGLKDHAYKMLQEREAARAGISRDELFAQNVVQKAGEPSKEEIDQLLAQYRSQLPPDDAEARKEVVNFLQGQRARIREQAWRGELLAAAGFKLLLEPPRLALKPEADDASYGPPDAPITIIEVSDFQCPYCQRALPPLQQVKRAYLGKVRLVYKHLPLPMHPQARLAAEASLCANAQGKFWEVHDWLFANGQGISEEALRKVAADLKMDVPAFGRCLADHTFAKKVDADMATAEKLGINSTPFFLVNGRIVEGARPFEFFKDIIDDELARVPAAGASK